jgi:hypothetical protein
MRQPARTTLAITYPDRSTETVPLVVGPLRAWCVRMGIGDVDELLFDDDTGELIEPDLRPIVCRLERRSHEIPQTSHKGMDAHAR